MTSINAVRDEVNAMIEALGRPLMPEDIQAGWNDALRQRWHDWFVGVKNKLDANTPFRRSEVNVAFGLGHAGVEPCPLTNNAERIGMMLMEIASQPSGTQP